MEWAQNAILRYPYQEIFYISEQSGSFPAEKIETFNAILKKYADENSILYLDYYSVMVDERKGLKAAYADDGVHPNKAGYEVMAPLVEKAIAEVLSIK